VPEGQALLSGILDTSFEVAQEIKARGTEEDVEPTLKPIYERLFEMKEQLDQLCKQLCFRQSAAMRWRCSSLHLLTLEYSIDASMDIEGNRPV